MIEVIPSSCRRVGELESIMARVEESCKKEVEATTSKLQDKTTEIATLRLENERLKVRSHRWW